MNAGGALREHAMVTSQEKPLQQPMRKELVKAMVQIFDLDEIEKQGFRQRHAKESRETTFLSAVPDISNLYYASSKHGSALVVAAPEQMNDFRLILKTTDSILQTSYGAGTL